MNKGILKFLSVILIVTAFMALGYGMVGDAPSPAKSTSGFSVGSHLSGDAEELFGSQCTAAARNADVARFTGAFLNPAITMDTILCDLSTAIGGHSAQTLPNVIKHSVRVQIDVRIF
jgi:hypothetical protein